MDSRHKTDPAKIPTEKELAETFIQVLKDWVGLAPQNTSLVYQISSSDAVERKVVLVGPERFHLVLRIPRDFASVIGRLLGGGPDGSVSPDDTFEELANIFCGHLKDKSWGPETPYTTHLPENSRIKDWPRRRPDVSCYLTMEPFSVEIFLWVSNILQKEA